MQAFPPPHCQCYQCESKVVLDYFKSVWAATNFHIEYHTNVMDKIQSMDLVYASFRKKKVILWSPEGCDYCVLVPNCADSLFSCVRYFRESSNILITGYSAFDLSTGEEPFVDFYRFGGNLSNRYVRVMREYPKWCFFEEGEPLQFELVDRYERRLKRERLTPEMVVEYMKQSGYNVLAPSFYDAAECITISDF